MTPHVGSAWPAQKPPGEFAERTVDAILRDRMARRSSARPRRWWGVWAIAAVLAAGGAWASIVLPQAPQAYVSVPPASKTDIGPAATTVQPTATQPLVTEGPSRPPQGAPPAAPRRYREPAAAHDAGRRARVPLCNCVQTICDCGEEP